jgi:hypothetical protein
MHGLSQAFEAVVEALKLKATPRWKTIKQVMEGMKTTEHAYVGAMKQLSTFDAKDTFHNGGNNDQVASW